MLCVIYTRCAINLAVHKVQQLVALSVGKGPLLHTVYDILSSLERESRRVHIYRSLQTFPFFKTFVGMNKIRYDTFFY